ncbi:MAG: hypothetical protein ACRCST_08935 [Turicibacter sp.]
MNREVLKKLAHGLNNLNCTWGIGGSVLLNYFKIIEKPNDIDVLINPDDYYIVKEFMDSIGTPLVLQSKAPFKTERFFGYLVDGTVIEFLGGFKIELENGQIYEFILDESAIFNYITVDHIHLNMTSLEDWFVAYHVMNDPKNRIPLLKDYFEDNGIEHPQLLKRNLSQPLPASIKEDMISLFN